MGGGRGTTTRSGVLEVPLRASMGGWVCSPLCECAAELYIIGARTEQFILNSLEPVPRV